MPNLFGEPEPEVAEELAPPALPGLFDYVNDILHGKKDIFVMDTSKNYNPFLVLRALSQHPDTVLIAHQLNQRNIAKDLHFRYLLATVKAKKRWSKWAKNEIDANAVSDIIEYYNCSTKRALEIAKVLTEDQREVLKQRISKGGIKKGKTK